VSESRRDLLVLTLGGLVLFGLRLGARDLWNPNEPIYGEAVVEMVQSGDWLLPHVNGLVFAEKPILFYWMALLASKLLGGVSALSLRLPSVAAGLATVLGSYVLTRPYAGRERAVASAVVAGTLFGVFWNARFVQMDILVVAATLWVVIAVTRVIDHGRAPLPGFILAGTVAGLGFAAKGPVAWVCPGLVLFAYLAATQRLRALLRWEIAAGAVACLCAAAPWYLMLFFRGRSDMITEVLLRQNFGRFVNPWDHRAPWWYYLQTFWVDMAPWGFFVPLAFGLKRRTENERRLALLSWLWIAAIVTFFTLSKSKRSPYILPVAPAVAVLAGEVALLRVADGLTRVRRAWFAAVAAALGGLFVIGGAAICVAAPQRLPEAAVPVQVLGLAAAIAGGFILFDLLRSKARPGVPASLATGIVVVYLAAAGVTLPALNVLKSARPVCDRVAGLLGPDDLVASYAFWNWRAEYRYYLGRPITNLFGAGSLREAWEGPRRVVLFVETEHLDDARTVIGDVAPAVAGKVGSGSIYVFTSR
jgi:4-amino-4-deoxy-L-arabinose transferase-like glycosyltransferase